MKKILVIILLLLSTNVYADDNQKLNIAVIDFKAQSPVSPSEAAFVTEFFRGELVMSDVFNIIEKENMDAILAEQGFQNTGCTTSDCAVQMGKILNTQRMITGKFGMIKNKYILTISIIDVETAKIVYSDNQTSKSIDNINDNVARLSDRVIDNVGGKNLKRKTDLEKRHRRYRDIQEYITHRKNKFSILENGRISNLHLKKMELGIEWSPLNYIRFGLNYARNYYNERVYYWQSQSINGPPVEVFKGMMDTGSFEINIDMPSVMQLINTSIKVIVGKSNYTKGVGVPFLWKLIPFVSYRAGITIPNGKNYLRKYAGDGNDYSEQYYSYTSLGVDNNTYLYNQAGIGLNIILSKNISMNFCSYLFNIKTVQIGVFKNTGIYMFGLEYTF